MVLDDRHITFQVLGPAHIRDNFWLRSQCMTIKELTTARSENDVLC